MKIFRLMFIDNNVKDDLGIVKLKEIKVYKNIAEAFVVVKNRKELKQIKKEYELRGFKCYFVWREKSLLIDIFDAYTKALEEAQKKQNDDIAELLARMSAAKAEVVRIDDDPTIQSMHSLYDKYKDKDKGKLN